jgi:hypothetical protein
MKVSALGVGEAPGVWLLSDDTGVVEGAGLSSAAGVLVKGGEVLAGSGVEAAVASISPGMGVVMDSSEQAVSSRKSKLARRAQARRAIS